MATDDKRQTLDIPNSATFELKDGRVVVGNETDVVLRGNMGGFRFQKIFSRKGSIQLIPPEGVELEVEEIEAPNGDVYLFGRVRAKSTRGKTVHFQDGQLSADIVEAKEEIVLQGKRLNVLHVKAPRVTVDPDAEGILMVVESQNDIGRFKAMGGFRSMDAAKSTLEQFQRVMGMPVGAPTAAPVAQAAPIAAEPIEDASMTLPGLPGGPTTAEVPVLPKSSVFRKRS